MSATRLSGFETILRFSQRLSPPLLTPLRTLRAVRLFCGARRSHQRSCAMLERSAKRWSARLPEGKSRQAGNRSIAEEGRARLLARLRVVADEEEQRGLNELAQEFRRRARALEQTPLGSRPKYEDR